MTAFDEPVARKPFADLGRDIGNVNKYYSRGQHPSERRAAEQFAAEQEKVAANVKPAMKTNNRLRNYMHFMAPLIQDYDNLDDDAADEVGERYRDLREAGLTNTIGGARANAMDRGVHDPLIRREDVSFFRSPPRIAQAEPGQNHVPAGSDGAGRKSLNLWQEGDPEPEMNLQAEPGQNHVPAGSDGAGRKSLNLWQEGDPEPEMNLQADAGMEGQAPAMPVQAEPQQARPVIDPRLAGMMLFGPTSVAASMMRGEPQAPQRDYSHLAPQTRRRAGGWANPLNWGWVKRLRNWWSGSSRVQAPTEAAAPEQADAPVLDQIATMDEAEQFRPQAAAAPGGRPVRGARNPMFGKMARRLSM